VISLGQLALPDSDVLVVPWMSLKKTPEHMGMGQNPGT